jgi:hypothetical protein
MIRKRVRTLWLLLCLLSVPCCAGRDARGLAEPYKSSFRNQLTFIVAKHPKYLWGGASDPEKGLDCSGYVFLAAKWAGIPGVTRTTSVRMAEGLGGWIGRDIDIRDAQDCDLPFWTFTENRINGHVGVILRDQRGRRAVTHASQTKGVVLEPLKGVLLRTLSKVRRLTIGE